MVSVKILKYYSIKYINNEILFQNMAKSKEGTIVLDEADRKLIWLLTENCRLSIKELAKRTGLTVSSVFRRIRFYEESGIVNSWTADLSLAKIGYAVSAYVTIKLRNISKAKRDELFDYLASHKNVSGMASTIGAYDLIIKIVAKDNEELETISNDIRQKFRDLIDDWMPVPVLRNYKFNFVPRKNELS
jgi:DNA-binding Lrp family transcriptional regulator